LVRISRVGGLIFIIEEKRTMDDNQLMEQTLNYVRLALPLMSKHNIPITPKNYAVWFKYFSFGDLELNRFIDNAIREETYFSKEFNESLYEKFCAEESEIELSKIKEELRQVLLIISDEISELTGRTDEYESTVSDSLGMLSDTASIQDIRQVVGIIIEKTKTLGQHGKSFSFKLKEATQALETLKKDFEQAKSEATIDALTGVANRKSFDNALAGYIKEAEEDHYPLTLLMIDIDRFKNFNDAHGHLIGDEVLKFVARKLKDLVKGGDLVARFGGEEFAVILPQTALDKARIVSENIRNFFSNNSLKLKTTAMSLGNLTVSIGIGSFNRGDSSETLIDQADQAMYTAKEAGRNCCADPWQVFGGDKDCP
jgi:diguanylate cyclase